MSARMTPEARSVYYIYKHGEERTFSSTRTPSPEWAASLRREGFTIALVRFTVEVPVDEMLFGEAEAVPP